LSASVAAAPCVSKKRPADALRGRRTALAVARHPFRCLRVARSLLTERRPRVARRSATVATAVFAGTCGAPLSLLWGRRRG